MKRSTRVHLLIAASLSASVASIPADGLRGILLGVSGAAFGLAALLTIKAGGAR